MGYRRTLTTKYLRLVVPYFLLADHGMAHAEIEMVASYAASPDWQRKLIELDGRCNTFGSRCRSGRGLEGVGSPACA